METRKLFVLPLVEQKAQVLDNVETLNKYLGQADSAECRYAKGLIRRGHCFVVVDTADGYRFFPSRFVGYINNSMADHKKMGREKTRDGKQTNPAISAILGNLITNTEQQWSSLEEAYKAFCKKLGTHPGSIPFLRKYWHPITPEGSAKPS